jgi:hypothetical protein
MHINKTEHTICTHIDRITMQTLYIRTGINERE